MKIVCCVKQVPVVEQLRFNAEQHTIVREGVDLQINPFDRRAVIEALGIRRQFPDGDLSVVAMTMGPPQANAVLRECLALGVDRAVHLLDQAFAGSDTLATARTLSRALNREHADVLLFGQYALDADTGHVPLQVAELLGLPCVTSARRIVVAADWASVEVERETEDGYEVVTTPLPAVLTLLDRQTRTVRPALRRANASPSDPEILTANDLNLTANETGSSGSPTWVEGLEVFRPSRGGVVVAGLSPAEAALRLADYLTAPFPPATTNGDEARSASAILPPPNAQRQGIWVLVETVGDALRPVTLELLGKAAELAAQGGGEIVALSLDRLPSDCITDLAAAGAERILMVDRGDGGLRGAMGRAAALASLLSQVQPSIVLVPSTPCGRETAARTAARLGLGLTADCLDVALNEDGRLIQFKPAFGGTIVARIHTRSVVQMATLRPGVLPVPVLVRGRQANAEMVELGPLPEDPVHIVRRVQDIGDAALALEQAEVVIGVGTGIEGDWNLPMVRELADVLGAAVASTRRAVETGIIPGQLQIGLTGKAIAPRLYLALGVRGNLNHMIGSMRAGRIVAVNLDPAADIFQAADFGIVGDILKIVPLLTEELRRRKLPTVP